MNKKLDLERTMKELKITTSKNQIKFKKKQKINVKMPHVNKKPLARTGKLVQYKKRGLESTMNGLGKQLRKNTIQ